MTDADTSPEAVNLHDTTDAAVWAKEFCKNWPTALCQVPGREGVESEDDFEAIMIGWFANAIMAGVDSEHRALSARVQELEAALRPFATFGALRGIELMPDHYVLTAGSMMAAKQVTAGEFKRAAAILALIPEQGQ